MQERKRKRAQLGNRKSAAAQSRMKSIATLAAEDKVSKKRKKNGEGKSAHELCEDGVCADDEQRTMVSDETTQIGQSIARL
jgi:hypothetical protein